VTECTDALLAVKILSRYIVDEIYFSRYHSSLHITGGTVEILLSSDL